MQFVTASTRVHASWPTLARICNAARKIHQQPAWHLDSRRQQSEEGLEKAQELSLLGVLNGRPSELSTLVDFLDLAIPIGNDQRIQFQTYQKPMNLCLHIPHGSAHALCARSLIFGNLKKH